MKPKNSGLADSPFFRSPSPIPSADVTPPSSASTPETSTPVPVFKDAQPHERSNAQVFNRTDVRLHERSDAQLHNRAPERTHERTDAQPVRLTTRESYDVYEDQAQAIEELQLKWSKARKKHVTKGQVMRELLDEILPLKR